MTNKDILIKVGFLLSYDYDFLRTSIPLVYKEADMIVLAKDYQSRTWSGTRFTIEPDFFDWLKLIDIDQKIKIYEDDFYRPELTLLENDTRERKMLGVYLGSGGWHVQLDADEYIVNFKGVVEFLKTKSLFLKDPVKKSVNFCMNFHVLYKQVRGGYLYVKGKPEIYQVATNNPDYTACRKTNGIEISTGFDIIHHTWARKPEEVRMKLENWTHARDFDTKSYFNLWNAIDENNYKYISDFHPMVPGFWKSLDYTKAETLTEAIHTLSKKEISKKNGLITAFKNNYPLKKFLKKIKRK